MGRYRVTWLERHTAIVNADDSSEAVDKATNLASEDTHDRMEDYDVESLPARDDMEAAKEEMVD